MATAVGVTIGHTAQAVFDGASGLHHGSNTTPALCAISTQSGKGKEGIAGHDGAVRGRSPFDGPCRRLGSTRRRARSGPSRWPASWPSRGQGRWCWSGCACTSLRAKARSVRLGQLDGAAVWVAHSRSMLPDLPPAVIGLLDESDRPRRSAARQCWGRRASGAGSSRMRFFLPLSKASAAGS